ncbi:ectoine/hydroxyectoine ABC transporter substrate-binding protein EhuB [Ensifer sp. BR816]|uniref:ectoine/hydroxyectoine ABC transporter substrate-binding protein EhuB n=1 Tax=Rhizobium sp. (strain BR816) TaxID=1057002 RepID=UPI00035F6D0B|nr:ectoine/hydroxyectoine ABC transporter substrate-binding protein EhuB [Ensifer sp. BR816]
MNDRVFTSSRRSLLKTIAAIGIVSPFVSLAKSAYAAQSLLERIKAGDVVKLGFANENPYGYPGDKGEPLGFINDITIQVLKKLGTTKIEPIQTEWGSLVPGLQAGRFDVITGGMFVLPDRCKNMLFTEPLGKFGDAFLVAKGNPQALHSFHDIRDKGLSIVTGAGWLSVKAARQAGIPDDKILQVAGAPEVVQAVKSGRAAAGSGDYFVMKRFVDNDNSLELADPFQQIMPEGYPALAFLPSQQEEVDAFNAVLKDYLGSDEMLARVAKYGYTKEHLPGSKTTADLCKG